MRHIIGQRSNQWIMVQTFLATVAYGSLVWMPRLFIAKAEYWGYSLETATISGNLLSLLFQTGFYFAILAGYLGDRFQRRHLGGRAKFCMITTLAAVPFQIAVFFVPLIGLNLPTDGNVISVALATFLNIVINPWTFFAFALALIAVAFSSADTPNRNALLTDVNLPEHRGTAVGLLAVAIGLGVATGNALAGLLFDYLAAYQASPLNYAVGLALFQLLFIPAGICYYVLSKTTPADIAEVRETLRKRGEHVGRGEAAARRR